MDPLVALLHQFLHAEAHAGYPFLRLVPSTRAIACMDYLDSLSPAEQEEVLEGRARAAALRFHPSRDSQQQIIALVETHPALARFREAMMRGRFAMGLRYQSIRMAQAMPKDPQSVALMQQTRSTLDFVPRDDAPVPLVGTADILSLHAAKAPQLKKLVKPLLQNLLGAKEEKMPGGTMKYEGSLDGTPVKVRVDYAGRDMQMIYAISIPDPERRVAVIGATYEQFFGAGDGWNYITEENAERSVALLPEFLRRVVRLRNEVARLS